MASSPTSFIPERLRRMTGYEPGLQLNDPGILKLNTNENAFPLPPAAIAAIEGDLQRGRLHLYPNPESALLRERLGAMYGKGPESVLIGNGSDEILRMVFQLFLDAGDELAVLEPSYSLYPVLAEMFGNVLHRVPLRSDWTADFDALALAAPKAKMAVITNPNAPTGVEGSSEDILRFESMWKRPVLVDEAYAAFGTQSVMKDAGTRPMLMACNTFSKSHSLAGMRIGWLVAHPDVIGEMDKIRDSYNVSFLAQACALAALDQTEMISRNVAEICRVRDDFSHRLRRLGFEVLPSRTNFVFASPPSKSGKAVFDYLVENRVLVRHFRGERLAPFVRISIGTAEGMDRLLELLQAGVQSGRF